MARNKKLLALLDKLTDIVDSIRAELENGNNDEEEDDGEIQSLDSSSVEKFDYSLNQNLNPNYTFENFVVGAANRLAHAASLAVSEMQGKVYNPLYIWGNVGLGKTHLLHAIAHRALELNPNLNILYLSAEKFINNFVQAIGDKQLPQFRKELCRADMLFVDDVQFFNYKEGSQEEFFHIFNTLHENGRQIVMAADRVPSDMRGMSELLTERFCWGLVTDIQKPDKALRAAILKKKAELKKTSIPDDVIQLLAQKIKSNVRELEGALNRVIINSELQRQPITVENVSEWLDVEEPCQPSSSQSPSEDFAIEDIALYVEETLSIQCKILSANARTRNIVLARRIAIYLCREMTRASLLQIAKAFNLKDHTAVIQAQRRISEQLKTDTELQHTVEDIKAKLLH